MNNVIIFTNNSGGVSVCVPTGELSIEEVQIKDIPSNVQSFIVNVDTLPKNDNDFFDAWEQEKGVITVNFEKAKEITKNRLRSEREPLLIALDISFQRMLESGSDTSAIISEKKRLRDITNLTNNCTTIEELRLLNVNSN